MSSHADTIRRVINRMKSLTVTGTTGYRDLTAADAALEALLAENQQLREVAAIARQLVRRDINIAQVAAYEKQLIAALAAVVEE